MAEGLKAELKDPIVTVTVTGFRENKVYILGEVKAPGVFPADTPLTIVKGVALAGDLTEKANRKEATLIPRDGEPRPVNLEKALGTPEGPGEALKAGDTLIILPQKNPSVVLWGEVVKPGKYELPLGKSTVMNAIVEAGGLTPTADMTEAIIIHPNGQTTQVDLVALLERHETKADVALADGDVVTVAAHRNDVMVLGAAGKQGPIQIVKGDRLSDLIALIGGLPDDADAENLRIVRNGKTTITANARAILKDNNMAANIEIRPGDTIFVPELRREVMVFGAAGKPGSYRLRENERVLDLLAEMGGPSKDAAPKSALIRREGEKVLVYELNLNEIIAGRQEYNNYELRDKDVLLIPEKGKRRSWTEILGYFFTATSLIQIFR
ncbi:MAG: SLBB domain-containing protein [Armatimonadota bacterium]